MRSRLSTWIRIMRLALACAVAPLLLPPGSALAAELEADFHFNGTRAAPTGEAVMDVGEGNAFAVEQVDGGAARQVLAFPLGSGLALPTTGLAESGSQSVVALFRLDSLATGRRKLLDFSGGSSDSGLYLCDGKLLIELLAASPCPDGNATQDGWKQVVFTRDGVTGEVRAYLEDDRPTAVDALGATSLASELRFFRDDEVLPGGEHSGGALARLRLYDGILTEAEVDALDRVDTSAPSVSLDSPPARTADQTPDLSGTAGDEAGDLRLVSVNLYSGSSAAGSPIRALSATPSGEGWSLTTAPPLADGTYTIQAQQADGAGNVGLSSTRTLTVDTAGPTVTLGAPTGATSDVTPLFSGQAGNASGDSEQVIVKVYAGSSASGPVTQTLTATRAGDAWGVSAGSALADGTYTARAEQSDDVGNVALTATTTFTIDTESPLVTLSAPAGGVTSDRTPTYAGAAGDASGDAGSVVVKIYSGSSAAGTPVQSLTAARSGSGWSAEGSPPLPDGMYTAQAEQADAAGNTGHSQTTTFSVDGAGPAVSFDTPVGGSATNDATPLYGGAAGDEPGDLATVTVKVYGGAAAAGTPVQTLTATRAGDRWLKEGAPPLGDGTYTAQAEQSDSAGNTNVSAPGTFTVDTVRPETSVTGAPADPTNDSTPEFTFSSPDGERFVCRLYPADGASAPPFENCSSPRTSASLAEGAYIFQVAAVDAAGNQDDSPGSRTFHIDTTAPRTVINVGPADTTATDAAFVFSADEPASFRCRLDDGAFQPCTSPKSYTGLALGPHTFEAVATDAAGNERSAASHSWQILQPGARIPAASLQAVTLAKDLVAVRRALKRAPLTRVARRGVIRIAGIDTLTAGAFRLEARARGWRFALASREVAGAGRYALKLKVTKRGRALARRVPKLRVDLTLGFIDPVGRSLRAKTSTTMTRTVRPRR